MNEWTQKKKKHEWIKEIKQQRKKLNKDLRKKETREQWRNGVKRKYERPKKKLE